MPRPDARRILVVDDNDSDSWLIQLAIRRAGIEADIRTLSDGEQAKQFLARGESIDLLILDLNLPRYSGHQVLDHLQQTCLQSVPTIVISSSDSEADRTKADQFTEHYFRKPLDLNGFLELGKLVAKVLGAAKRAAT